MNLSTPNKSEVDKRVAQELKNNQDFIYQTNTQIQVLQQKIIDLTIKLDKTFAKSDSNVKSLLIAFENLEYEVLNSLKNLTERMDELESSQTQVQKSVDQMHDGYTEHNSAISNITLGISDFQKNLDILEHGTITTIEDLDRSINFLRTYVHNEFKEIRELCHRPDVNIEEIYEYVDEKLMSMYVDIAGFRKETILIKKAQDYNEKKFENIYTLIQRMKKDS